MLKFINKIVSSKNTRLLKKYHNVVQQINHLEESYKNLDDTALLSKKDQFKERIAQGEALDNLLVEAFATVREAADRALGMRHFDVQLMGGIGLHQGKISEMRTGEGKTLVATLPAYLNALTGGSVHIVTVNDYLARRDAEWMGEIYHKLGLSVDVVVSGQNNTERKAAYQAEVTYGTNNEFGFDYLRDNMVFLPEQQVQRGHYFAVVDEVDSILIDEARTPLIISGPSEASSDIYYKLDKLVRRLKISIDTGDDGDYTIDEKARQAFLTEKGHQVMEDALIKVGLLKSDESLYDLGNIGLLHHVGAALRAHSLFKKNVDYIVRHNKVLIVDEFTGRVMEGRRWSDGLHQAVEAKENVHIEHENQTLASITFQNYFRLYEKLSGMTGTAETEAQEFQDIYGLEVVVIPTHKSMIREDQSDLIYMTKEEKFEAIIEDIRSSTGSGQPVLIGTASIAISEHLSEMLRKEKIKHQVLNAKNHEAESQIIAQAGMPGAVTIATNMAGRGTDIVLGGALEAELSKANAEQHSAIRADWKKRHQQVVEAGGLRIIGTERHESRRVDNQLRGRSGRQGDPGSSQFYLSLQDDLMRIFASDKVQTIMEKLGMQSGEVIEHPWVSRAIENAQRKVEAHNFDIRKNLLEYDNVANEQRQIIYKQRKELMESDTIRESILEIITEVSEAITERYVPEAQLDEQWDLVGLEQTFQQEFDLQVPVQTWFSDTPDLSASALREKVSNLAHATYQEKENIIDTPQLRMIEVMLMLKALDYHWKEHLANMDHLRQGIGLRSFAQKNPKQEYKREAFSMFESMLDTIRHDLVSNLMKLREPPITLAERPPELLNNEDFSYQHQPTEDNFYSQNSDSTPPTQLASPLQQQAKPSPIKRKHAKLGRNEPCFCGSGKKYKHCHGRA